MLQRRRPLIVAIVVLCGFLLAGLWPTPARGGSPASPAGAPEPQEGRFFPETGFRIGDDRFFSYFEARGGIATFGFPTSRRFLLLGTRVQFFQRHVMQLQPDGDVGLLNILNGGLLEFTNFGDVTIPAADPTLLASAPGPDTPDYGEAVRAFITAYVPNEWQGLRVGFLEAFLVPGGAAGEVDPVTRMLIGLEILGFPTSRPAPDPNNAGFVYQRFQRGALHFDSATGLTQPLLLADYLKGLMTGRNVPLALQAQAAASRLYLQYNPGRPLWVSRPNEVPDTDLTAAFEREDQPLVAGTGAGSELGALGPPPQAATEVPTSVPFATPVPFFTPPPLAPPFGQISTPVPAPTLPVFPTPTPVVFPTVPPPVTPTATPVPPDPRIDGLEPWTLAIGQDLVIRGKGFGTQPGHVIFTAKLTTALIWGDTHIIVTVPQGAVNGTVRVRRPDGMLSNPQDFTIAPVPVPTALPTVTPFPTATETPTGTPVPSPLITGLSIGAGRAGDTVVIDGRNFGATTGNVLFGTTLVAQVLLQWTDTRILVPVPQRDPGPATIFVLPFLGSRSNGGCFTILPPLAPTATPGGAASPTPTSTPLPTATPGVGCT